MSARAVIKGHTIHRTIRIEAPLDRVWEAISTPILIGQWFSETATFDGADVGSTGVFAWEGYGEFAVVITENEPKSAFAWRWAGNPSLVLRDDDSTTARFTLEPDGDATIVTVVETGFDGIAGGTAHRRQRLEDNRAGWDIELDELAALLETA
ncbi:MAG: SRPBCC domain-containing protein [Microbacteriaceae bacterium]